MSKSSKLNEPGSGEVPKKRGLRRRAGIGVGAALLLYGAGRRFFSLIPTDELKRSQARPAAEYDEAVARLEQWQAQEGPNINPVCRSQLLTHGRKVAQAIIFVHGIPNCPKQFSELGQLFYERGYNVLIPRMPRCGLADRTTTELKNLKSEELREFADEMVDIAHGLGEQVTIVGLSAGGVVAAWVAQFRPDVDKAVLIAPALSIAGVPERFRLPITKFIYRVPNIFIGRSPQIASVSPPHVYSRQASRSIGHMLRLAVAVLEHARTTKPGAKSVVLVTTASENQVDNKTAKWLVNQWQSKGLQNLTTYEFELNQGIAHDMIDPLRGDQKTHIVYPVLVDLITDSK